MTKTSYPRASAVMLAAALAASVLVLAAAVEPAEAAFPGKNGKIAYTNVADRGDEVAVSNPDGTGAVNLTKNKRIDDREPSWSADGERIAFVSDRDGQDEIYTMNADGSDQRRLTESPEPYGKGSPTWSPDGAKIAFTAENDSGEFGSYDIYMVNADGTGLTQLTTDPSFDYDPDWSPDGTKIAFHSWRDGHRGIHTMAPVPEGDGNRVQRIVFDTGKGGTSHLDWQPIP